MWVFVPVRITLKGVVVLKKLYHKPLLEEHKLSPEDAIANDPSSFPFNDGELGWS